MSKFEENPQETAVQDAARHARASAVEILGTWEGLSISERRTIVRAFHSSLVPRRRAGRKQSETITAAYDAWKGGMRGAALYQNHIPNWDRLSRWRRKAVERSLMEAIYSRNRRARAKQAASASEDPCDLNKLSNPIPRPDEELFSRFDQSRPRLESDRGKAKQSTDIQ